MLTILGIWSDQIYMPIILLDFPYKVDLQVTRLIIFASHLNFFIKKSPRQWPCTLPTSLTHCRVLTGSIFNKQLQICLVAL